MRTFQAVLLVLLVTLLAGGIGRADTLVWNTNSQRVSADIHSAPLMPVLNRISQLTGWQVFVESNSIHTVSAKFDDLPSGQALRLLLGNLNFALVPQTNSPARFYVFHSHQRNATFRVDSPDTGTTNKPTDSRIPNELVITLKRGARIQDLACLENARITGRIDPLNTYRIQFADEAAAKLGRECLAGNPDVESIDSNFAIDSPHPVQSLDMNIAPDPDLKLKEASGDCKVIIGLIDTRVGSLGGKLDQFLLPSISVVPGASSTPVNGLSHGPAMAETILRALQTTSTGGTGVRILPVDVYGDQPTTTTFDVSQGIYKAMHSGANVINLSLGSSGDSSVLHNLIRQGSAQGIVFFSAAGNQPVTTPVYPAAYPEVLAVTAGDRNGQIASYANRGDFVDLMAPGTSVVPYNGQSYLVNGTSAATAYASGLAAGLAEMAKDCPDSVIPAMRSRMGVSFGQ